jgi:hypothetical protein
MKFLILFLFSVIANAEAPRWSVETLTGVTAYHDGANCFNAALAAAGYTDDLAHMSPGEFHFFVNNFCRKIEAPTHKNDFVVLFYQKLIDHVSLYVNENQVFEKEGSYGFFHAPRATSPDNGKYRLISQRDSTGDQWCGESCRLESFRCDLPEKVKPALASCEQQFPQFEASPFRKTINALTFEQNKVAIVPDEFIQIIEDWTIGLKDFKTHDSCSLHMLMVSFSVYEFVLGVNAGMTRIQMPFANLKVSPGSMPRFKKAYENYSIAFKDALFRSKANSVDSSSQDLFDEVADSDPWLRK